MLQLSDSRLVALREPGVEVDGASAQGGEEGGDGGSAGAWHWAPTGNLALDLHNTAGYYERMRCCYWWYKPWTGQT